MDSIVVEGNDKTPSVNCNAEKGIVEIRGRSIPENAIDFYKPVIDWLDDYSKVPQKKTNVNIQLEYFNTSSSKCILDVFKKLATLNKDKSEVTVNWYFEEDDEDMLEAGEDYQSIVNTIPFKMIEIVE